MIEQVFKQRAGRLAVYFRNFPLAEIHPLAIEAAIIGERAKDYGVYAAAHKSLFASNFNTAKDLTALSGRFVLKTSKIELDTEARSRIQRDLNLGISIGVRGTPSLYYINEGNDVFLVNSLEAL